MSRSISTRIFETVVTGINLTGREMNSSSGRDRRSVEGQRNEKMNGFTLSLIGSQAQAEALFERLKAAGFSPDELAALRLDEGGTRELAHEKSTERHFAVWAGAGATLGGIAGLIAHLAGLVRPGLAPFITAGCGALAGTLVALGVRGPVAKRSESAAKSSSDLKLHYWNHSWPLLPCLCPCDTDFISYLRARRISRHAIFHFGSGAHHALGKANLEAGAPNEILAVTASPQEHRRYVEWVIENPAAATHYKVLFADIYTLNEGLLPVFDLVTLFHLHEFYDETNRRYAQLDDRSLLDVFLRKLSDRGRVLFYKGSNGFGRTARTLEEYTSRQRLVFQEEYRSLLIYCLGPNRGVGA
jgi:hypothetical protein